MSQKNVLCDRKPPHFTVRTIISANMAAEAGSSSKGFAKSFSKKMFRTKEKVRIVCNQVEMCAEVFA